MGVCGNYSELEPARTGGVDRQGCGNREDGPQDTAASECMEREYSVSSVADESGVDAGLGLRVWKISLDKSKSPTGRKDGNKGGATST